MEKSGFVVQVHGSKALVEVARESSCGDNCGHCGGSCSVVVTRVEVENTQSAGVGDRVLLDISEREMLKSGFKVYTLPMIGLVVGILIGMNLAGKMAMKSPDMIGLLSGILLMCLTFWVTTKNAKLGSEMITMKSVLRPIK